ncbi:RHS repeat protein [Thiothrix fructosivorans]|uniref:RHS repeat protein n=1 Tax=Thiothrix fructosivorans TaxID=111770 RepID=A0A8B0SP74_9GAMM|nr:RHS repeat protein [Thiothrix fructosivorans]MBO0613078.1 RHS repeat protein [Thiothrix fructosivorans]QTX11477.1 RHS repeat protein [Thiothrix fructosivorans]
MISRRLLVTAVLTALATTACNDNNNNNLNQTNGNATKVASRYYLAPEAAGNSASINGVDVSTGKITYDTNDMATSQLTLSRQYSSAGVSPDAMGGWQHNYSSSLDAGGIPTTEWQGAKSTEYPDAETACESGWQQISGSAYNGQLQTADAVFNAGLCELKLNGTTVARLPVQGSDGNSSYPVHILTRADGSRITFYEQNGEWATTTREPYQLASTASGWNVTTPDGSVESYNLAGKFDSITNPQGQTTTLSYNGAGQLETVTSPFGQALTFSYTDGKLTQAKSAAGTTAYAYGADGKLSQVTLPDGGTQSYCYTADGKLDSISDATGAVVARYTYDTEGRVIHTEAAAGTQARAFAYNGAETSVTDVANATTDTYAHRIIHSLARATRSTDSAGAVETTEYDTNGYPTKTVDKNGLVTLTTWNARGLPESTTTAAGTAQARTIVTEWHPHFRKPSKQVAAGMVTLYEYDTDGKLTNTTAGSPAATASRMSARSATTQLQAMRSISSRAALKSAGYEVQESTIAYNDAGQPTETIAPNGASTHYDYDTAGNQTAVTNALNHTSKTLKYDAAGRALKTRDENGLTTTNVYDVAGRLTNSTTNGQTTTYAYDVAGRQTKTTYPDGSYSTTAYDAAGNTASTTDAQGTATTYTYDSNGNQLTESLTDASGNTRQTSRRDYNALNQLEKSTDADGNVTTYGYDKAGNQTSVTDASGRVTTHEYDPQNRLVKTTDAAGGITQYAYDADGNRTTVIAANGATTAYVYDNFQRMTGETSPDRGNTTNTYDISSNLKTSADANGNTAMHEYDLLNRKVKTTWQDGSIATWDYDNCTNGIGRLCTLTDGSGSTTYTYDNEGRTTQKTQTIGNSTLFHRYAYTADGKLQSEILPSGATIGYTYTQDKLTGISINGQAYMSNIRYTAAGQVASWQWADGTTYQKTYDANNRLKTFPLGGTVRTLNYDSVGNITGWDDNNDAAKAKHFSYDLLDRLDGYTAANEAQAFQYDPNGNRTAKTDNGNTTVYGLQANSNRLTQIGSTAQAQDANGNLLNDGTHAYTYNAQNRLASVDGTTAYTYNADDQRVKKTTPTGTTLYAWDNERIIGEYDQNGAGQQASETVYFGSTPVAVIQNGNVYRIYADQIDTPRIITDAAGKTVWMWDSKPFGETAPNEDPDKDGLVLRHNPRFPGQTFDAETGLHYNFHRDYNPATGRYVQSDPIGLDGGMNSFGYVEGNPLTFYDENGLKLKYEAGKIEKYYKPLVDKIKNINSTGKKLIDFIVNAPNTFTIKYMEGTTGSLKTTRDLYLDPAVTYKMCARAVNDKKKTVVTATSNQLRIFTHELGHVAGASDNGAGEMNNVNAWENPIAKDFDSYIRTQYNSPPKYKCAP